MTEDRDRDRDLSRRLFMRETVIGGAAAVAASGTAGAQEEGGEEGGEGEGGGEGEEGGGEGGEGEEGGGEGEEGGGEGGGEGEEGGGEGGEGEGGGEGEEGGGGGGGDQVPAWSSFVQDANNFDETDDQRGSGEVTIQVGAGDDGLAFDPAGVWVDAGTTVIWEWTGEGGAHNVSSTEGEEFQSDTTEEAGFTFEHTFEEAGINEYECEPHTGQGMHGGVAVGEEIETTEAQSESGGGEESTGVELPDSAKSVGVALTVALGSTLGLTYVFMKYGGDYEGDRVE